jgi:large subunit ribosomal protein L22
MPTASTIINKSPRKVRLMINVIRGMRLSDAFDTVRTMKKGKTDQLYKLLKSAASNLGISDTEYKHVVINTITAEEAQRLYRIMPRARGSASKIRRRYSRVKVELLKITK